MHIIKQHPKSPPFTTIWDMAFCEMRILLEVVFFFGASQEARGECFLFQRWDIEALAGPARSRLSRPMSQCSLIYAPSHIGDVIKTCKYHTQIGWTLCKALSKMKDKAPWPFADQAPIRPTPSQWLLRPMIEWSMGAIISLEEITVEWARPLLKNLRDHIYIYIILDAALATL